MLRPVSLHPKLAAFCDLIINATFLWGFFQLENWWLVALWFFSRVIFWGVLTFLVYFPKKANRIEHVLSLTIFLIGCLFLFLFIEWNWSWYVVGSGFVFFPVISFWLVPPKGDALSYVYKSYRRWKMLLAVLGLAGLWSGVSAIIAFQVVYWVGNWVWMLLGALITAAITAWWWKNYDIKVERKFWIWSVITFLFIFELAWVIYWWPLGYLASGVFMAWVWYIFWLLIRFHLTKEDVVWNKQRWFIITNTLLICAYLLLVVRWN